MATRSIVAPLHGILGLLIIVAGCSRSDTPPSGDPASGDPNAVDPSPAELSRGKPTPVDPPRVASLPNARSASDFPINDDATIEEIFGIDDSDDGGVEIEFDDLPFSFE